MTLYEFNAQLYARQLVTVFDTGTFLATRWEEENAVNLRWSSYAGQFRAVV